MDAEFVGQRVRHWRLKRGISQRTLAELAGFTQGYISQIEAGTVSADKRSTQAAIAQALQVSVADLTGQPYDPRTIEHSAATAAIPQLRAALLAVSLGEQPGPSISVGELRARVNDAILLHNACRYDQLVPALPQLLLDLHASHASAEAGAMSVWTAYAATFAAKYLGFDDLAILAAQQCRASAAQLGEEAWCAVAEFALLHTLPHEANVLTSQRVISVIERFEPLTADTHVRQVYGMLHLTAAMRSAVAGRSADAMTHLTAAQEAALSTGETNFAQMWFGPTNVAIWGLGVYAELREGDRACGMAHLDVTRLGSQNRQATHYADLARCLGQVRGYEEQALSWLLRAEAIAPQRVRLSPAVRETVGAMMRRARTSAGGTQLQKLAARLGTLD